MKQIRILKDKDVAKKLGVSRTTVWNLIKKVPSFPKPFSLSIKSTGWYEHEVDEFIATRAQFRFNSQFPKYEMGAV